MVHCSGGGQTKCIRFGTGVHHIKDNFLPVPPIFKAIQKASGTTDEEMFRVYNMGHRSESFGIPAQVIGRTEPSQRPDGQNHVTIQHAGQTLTYQIQH